MNLKREKILSIPFPNGKTFEIQTGFLVGDEGTPIFRYSRSMEFVRGRYRLTFQRVNDPEHTPYVFDVIRSSPNSEIDIRAENKAAQDSLAELRSIVELLYRLEIESV